MSNSEKKGSMVKVIALVVVIAVVGVGAGVYLGGRGVFQSAQPTISTTQSAVSQVGSVATAVVTSGSISKNVTGDGTLTAQNALDVLTPTQVTILQLPHQVGDEVNRGDVLARVDKNKVATTLADLKSQLASLDTTVKSLSGDKASSTIYAPVKGRIKLVYAEKGEDVNTVIQRDGALLLLSTDGLMQVAFRPESWDGIRAGATVDVKDDRGNIYDGRVALVSKTDGVVTVTFTDKGPKVDEDVSVYMGGKIGSGLAKVNQPLLVTAAGGTVSTVSKTENTAVGKGDTLFVLKDVPLSDDYTASLYKRQDLQDQINAATTLLMTGEITAPNDGIIEKLYEDVTSLPLSADTAILSLASKEELELVVAIDELDIPYVEIGQQATVTISALVGQTFSGQVKRVSSVGKISSGITTYDVTLKLQNAPKMKIGMNSTAIISVERRENTLLIPASAVISSGGLTYVNVLSGGVDAGGNPLTQRVPVEVGISDGANVEIISGIALNTQVKLNSASGNVGTTGAGAAGGGGMSGPGQQLRQQLGGA